MKPLFDDLADATLERVKQTYTHTHENGRGAQYGDTWRECEFLTVGAVNAAIRPGTPFSDWKRAIALAAYIDMKLERMRGGYRDDNLVDLIAYSAALAEQMKRIEEANK